MFDDAERRYVERARLARLATADADGRPHVVPVCFALVDDRLVTPLDEKPKDVDPRELRRVGNVRANPRVSLVVDHYHEDWARLGWVQVRGTARLLEPDDSDDPTDLDHESSVRSLESKYDQYADHDLASRPVIAVDPGSVVSWGELDPDAVA